MAPLENVALNIGNDRQVLSIDDDDNLVWRTYYADELVVFVILTEKIK